MKKELGIGLIVALIFVGAIIILSSRSVVAPTEPVDMHEEAGTVAPRVAAVTVVVSGSDGENVYPASVPEGTTALAATQQVIDVTASGSGEAAFVTAVNGVAARESAREFWKLVINGEDAQVGAGSYVVQDGDRLEWMLDTY